MHVSEKESIIIGPNGELKYIEFPNLKKYNSITHCFTTRKGGKSSGECLSLNLGFNRNDNRENVEENYRIISEAINVDYRNMVLSNQVHGTKIKIVDENDRGKGIIKKSDIIGYDGLVTNSKEVVLVTFYADCVPLYFFDPVNTVIALSHSGWRGTVSEIARETITLMNSHYGSKPEDIEVAVGPSIGKCCFEVGGEVYSEFIERIPYSEPYCIKKGNGKWHIDLKSVIEATLLNCGIREEKLFISGICTKCSKDTFFSHRGDCGKTGSLAAIMQINS